MFFWGWWNSWLQTTVRTTKVIERVLNKSSLRNFQHSKRLSKKILIRWSHGIAYRYNQKLLEVYETFEEAVNYFHSFLTKLTFLQKNVADESESVNLLREKREQNEPNDFWKNINIQFFYFWKLVKNLSIRWRAVSEQQTEKTILQAIEEIST